MALGKPEHGGRVRGQGTHVKQSVYFDLPRQKKARTMDERIQEGVQKFMAVETPRIIKERDAFWAAEIQKIRAELSLTRGGCHDSPKPTSQQASCHSNGAVVRDVGVSDPNTPETAKKIFSTEEDRAVNKVKMIDTIFVDFGEEFQNNNKVASEDDYMVADQDDKKVGGDDDKKVDGEDDKKVAVMDDNGVHVVEKNEFEKVKVDGSGSFDCKLAIGSLSNIVAFAKMHEVPFLDGREQTIHGVKLGEANARVSITQVIQGNAKIPFPIGDEIVSVQEAMGTFIAWPKDLINIYYII